MDRQIIKCPFCGVNAWADIPIFKAVDRHGTDEEGNPEPIRRWEIECPECGETSQVVPDVEDEGEEDE